MPQPPKSTPRKYLRRYTHLPALLHLLRERKLTLLDPSSWDDSNDSYYVNEYKSKRELRTVLALCLSQAPETYHHWRVFAGSPAGVCIRFRQGSLLRVLRQVKGVSVGVVQYLKIAEARKQALSIDELPFVKRAAFEDEAEVRVLYESAADSHVSLEIPISLDCISRITFSPWLPKPLVAASKQVIQAIEGCQYIEVVRSSLIGNEEWKKRARNAE